MGSKYLHEILSKKHNYVILGKLAYEEPTYKSIILFFIVAETHVKFNHKIKNS